ncbi:hypothetical protein GCM10022222_27880 [Amycolatopsis ultiminotia]|uniref:Uncharacterized protein n=1 Tax=Amycolatopsis ultiminotia TaxID=543629 RepID=A0ABP6W287_9PSEU
MPAPPVPAPALPGSARSSRAAPLGSVSSSRALSGPFRWLLLGLLVVGVLAMHHVPTPHEMPAPPGISEHAGMPDEAARPSGHLPMPTPPTTTATAEVLDNAGAAGALVSGFAGGVHSMGHLCLAVLLGVAGLVLALVARGWSWRGRAFASGRGAGGVPAARAPPWPAGRGVLGVCCVLRI